MLRKYQSSRSLRDNLNLGLITSFSAGMVNVASLVMFFAFTSNVTGHYAILAQEIADGRFVQVFIVFTWLSLFWAGSFFSNYIVVHSRRVYNVISHSLPMLLQMILLIGLWIYGELSYEESLAETEVIIGILLFIMGLQNGLTATLSNFAVKTTHLTGLTTDLAIHTSLLTIHGTSEKQKKESREKIRLFLTIMLGYVSGGVLSGIIINWFEFKVFLSIAIVIFLTILYDYRHLASIMTKKNSKKNI